MEINKRSFKRDGCKVIQDPSDVKLFECSSDCGVVSGKLSILSGLFYIGIIDPGEDRFTVSLEIKRPARWKNGPMEAIDITREFLNFSEMKKWILSLEMIILEAIFPKENSDNRATEARENRIVIKMLLELTKDFTELNGLIQEDAKKRQDILYSH
jgi:hypothetical protein